MKERTVEEQKGSAQACTASLLKRGFHSCIPSKWRPSGSLRLTQGTIWQSAVNWQQFEKEWADGQTSSKSRTSILPPQTASGHVSEPKEKETKERAKKEKKIFKWHKKTAALQFSLKPGVFCLICRHKDEAGGGETGEKWGEVEKRMHLSPVGLCLKKKIQTILHLSLIKDRNLSVISVMQHIKPA